MSDLEKDFTLIVEEINAKLAEATAALKQANQLREQAGLLSFIWSNETMNDLQNEITCRLEISNKFEDDDSLYDAVDIEMDLETKKYEMIDVSELEIQLDQGGWRTSSSYCVK